MMGRPQADRDSRAGASVRGRDCRRRRLARGGGPPLTEKCGVYEQNTQNLVVQATAQSVWEILPKSR